MALDPEIGLVGRDSTAALLESLIDRRGRSPLPIVVAFGPGGSGKTALLDHVERRCRPEVPVARVDLDETGSKSCRDVLDVIFGQLRRFSHREFGRLRLARYELARLALTGSAQSEEDTDPHRRARKLIAQRVTFLPKVTEAVAEVAESGRYSQWIGKLVRPVSRWLVAAAVVAPPWLRWLLVGKRLAAVLRWYERVAGRKLLGLSAGCTVDEVIVRVWDLAASEDRHARLTLDRVLVAAFLHDLRSEYRWHRHRKVNCVLLLDGADLLSPFELNLFPPEQPEPRVANADFLELLAQERLEHPDVPLLVVATKQATSEVDDIALSPQPTEDGHARSNPVEAARARYGAWLQGFEQAHGEHGTASAAYLPVWLRPFTLEQTRQFLAEWHRSRSSTAEDEPLVQELYEVTRGHPLAVRLAIQVVDRGFRRDRVIPAVRTVFAARVPRDEVGAEPTESVADYLLLRFLQRFRASTVDQRARTRRLLARLAAPRRLDIDTIRLLAPGRDAEDTLSSLATYSFTERGDNGPGENGGYLVLHPLLRDLLAKELLETDSGGTYEQVHRTLRDHYATVGREGDRLYHALALRETTTVASHLAARLGQDRGWTAELEAAAEAPMRPIGDPAPARAAWVVDILRPRVRRMQDLVIALSQLRSCTSDVHRTAEVIDSVLRAYRALAVDDPAVAPALDRYRVLLHAAEGDATPVSPPQLPDYCAGRGRHPYPLVWPRRHAIRRIALTAAVTLLVGYGIVYAGHRTWHCDRDGPLAVWPVTSTLWDDSRALSKERGGQCIGVTDAVGNFVYDQARALADDTEVGELSRLIHEQNLQVRREADTGRGRPYVTVVVATMLSSTDEEPKRDISAGVNELRGVYLAQRDWNQFNTAILKPNFLLRVLLANFGGNSEFAEQTATQIRKLVAQDPTVVAVTGMGQTRDSTMHAADLLGTLTTTWQGIPMVGSAPSGDGFTGKPEFFRVAPPNKRQAKVGVDFITKDDRFRGRKPYVVYDHGDRYSEELKNDYEQYLKDDQASAHPRLAPVQEEAYEADQASTGRALAQRVADICKESAVPNAPRPLVVYSGRANEMPTLLDELSRSSCGQDALIVGGDDLTQLETAGYRDLVGREDYANGRLFFTTFGATRDGWQQIRDSTQLRPNIERFFTDHQKLEEEEAAHANGKAFRSGPNGHVMLAYDAVNLVLDAVKRTAQHGSPIPNPNQVYDALRKTSGDAVYEGVTGRVDFGQPDPALERGGADPVNKLLVVQSVVKDQGKLRSRYLASDGG